MKQVTSWALGLILSAGYMIALSSFLYLDAFPSLGISTKSFLASIVIIHLVLGFFLYPIWPVRSIHRLIITPSIAFIWGALILTFFRRTFHIVDEGIGIHIGYTVLFAASLYVGAFLRHIFYRFVMEKSG